MNKSTRLNCIFAPQSCPLGLAGDDDGGGGGDDDDDVDNDDDVDDKEGCSIALILLTASAGLQIYVSQKVFSLGSHSLSIRANLFKITIVNLDIIITPKVIILRTSNGTYYCPAQHYSQHKPRPSVPCSSESLLLTLHTHTCFLTRKLLGF